VTLADLARVPSDARLTTRVADVRPHPTTLSAVPPETPLLTVLASTGLPRGTGLILVVEDDRLVGVVSAADVARTLELVALHQTPGPADVQPPSRAA